MVYREFLSTCQQTFSASSYHSIYSALRLSHGLLRDLRRYDGTPLIFHSVNTALIVVNEIGLGRNSAVSTILHDASRLGLITADAVRAQFGDKCVELLQGMNNISQVDPKTSTLQIDNFKELIVSYSTDPRVILIKIADRLEVMRSLGIFPESKRIKKSWETLHLYAPIAHKLGLYNIKSELEDLSLRHLETKDYQSIERKLAESESERSAFIKEFVRPITDKLDTLGLHYKLKSRTKSIYSIWRKMKKQKVPFEGVFDVFAIRIILDCPVEVEKMQCWTAYSVVTDFYTPNPERMRDWISIPKSNGYESLHSTVVTTSGKWVEVQIRTLRMDEVAERGVAAHWRYKGVAGGAVTSEQWLERLRFAVENTPTEEGFNTELDMAINSSEIFVFTPTGDIRKLPKGATVLDFAFDIHSNLGSTCVGGKINGRNVSIKEQLNSGDIAEVTTSKNQRPKADWLSVVVTGKAKSKIKQILREDTASAAIMGREELERKLKNWKLTLTIEEAVTALSKQLKLKTGMEVYMLIADEKISMGEIKELLIRYIGGDIAVTPPKPRKEKQVKATSDNDDALIVDQSLKNVEYKLGKCCNPIFGDDIFGFVTVHTGITIHRDDCPNALRLREQYPYRMIAARWQKTILGGNFLSQIRIVADDRQGLANELTELVSRDLKINIRSMSFTSNGGIAEGKLAIEVGSTTQVDMVIANIKKIKGVLKATRVN